MKNSKRHTIPESTISQVQLGPPPHTSTLFGEWQQRGPETLSGYASRKLRLALAPTYPATVTGVFTNARQ